jgi:hypothetical protein
VLISYQHAGFFTIQPLDLADSLRELHYTQSPGEQDLTQVAGVSRQMLARLGKGQEDNINMVRENGSGDVNWIQLAPDAVKTEVYLYFI